MPTLLSDESHSVADRYSDSDDLFDVDITCDMTDDKGLPTLPVQFGNIDTFALLDCASKLNLVSVDFLFQLGLKESDIKPTKVRIKGVTGDVSCAYGEIQLEFTLMKRKFQTRFICVLQAVFPATVLLSYSSMRQFNIVTDWNARRVWFADDVPSATEICFNTQAYYNVQAPNNVHNSACDIISDSRPIPIPIPNSCASKVGCDSVCVQDNGSLMLGHDKVNISNSSANNSSTGIKKDLCLSPGYADKRNAEDTASVGLSAESDASICNSKHEQLASVVLESSAHSSAEGNINSSCHEVFAINNQSAECSFVCFNDDARVRAFVAHDTVLETNIMSKVVLDVSSLEDGTTVCIIGESCRLSGIRADNGIATVLGGKIFVYAVNTCDFTRSLCSGSHFIDIAVIPLEIMFLNDEEGITVLNSMEAEDDAREIRKEVAATDFPNHLSSLIDVLSKHRKAVALKGESLGQTDLITHSIDLQPNMKPRYIPAYRLPHSRREIVDEIVEGMKKEGVISDSSSPFNSPLILVPKKDGGWRPCVDYRALNSITISDRYPMPVLRDVLHNLGGKRVFSSLDLLSGYWQVGLDQASKQYTAFSTHSGHFEFNVMPFGLTNSPLTFVRLMDTIFKDLKNVSVLTYLDDIIIFSNSLEDHFRDLDQVLGKLSDAGLKIKLRKCQMLRSKLNFLGHEINAEGVKMQIDKIEKLVDYPPPRDKKGIKRFMGMVNYYRPFIDKFAEIASPITKLLKKDIDFLWGEAQQSAFLTLKSKITTEPILSYPNYQKPFIIACDASDVGIGAVLLQKGEKRLMPIAYASKLFSDTEKRYSVTEREALGVVWSLKKFRDICLGYPVQVLTDHKPVLDLFKCRNLTGKLARWFLHVQEFNPSIAYIPGAKNNIADALSRIGQDLDVDMQDNYTFVVQEVDLDLDVVKDEQLKDSFLGEKIRSLEKDPMSVEGFSLLDGILYRSVIDSSGVSRVCLCVPKPLISRVLFLLHSHKLSGHPGIQKTTTMAKRNYSWAGMANDIKVYVSNCEMCHTHKGQQNKQAPLEFYPTVLEPWEMVSMDFLGPLPVTDRGNQYLLVFIDYLSRYVELVPTVSRSAIHVAEALRHRVITRHSAPKVLISDNAKEFTGDVLKKICEFYEISKVATVPYKPSSNGLVERNNRKVLDHLRTLTTPLSQDWDFLMDDIQIGINCTVNSTTGETPHFILYGYEKRLPHQLLCMSPKIKPIYNYEDYVSVRTSMSVKTISSVREALLKSAEKRKLGFDIHSSKPNLKVGQKVYILNHVKQGPLYKVSPKFLGPFRVIELLSKGKCKLRSLKDSNVKISHWNHLKIIKGDIDPFYVIDGDLSQQIPDVPSTCEDEPIAERTRSKS